MFINFFLFFLVVLCKTCEKALGKLKTFRPNSVLPLSLALVRLRGGDRGDDFERLDKMSKKQAQTADEILLDWLADKSVEVVAPLEAMRMGAVDANC